MSKTNFKKKLVVANWKMNPGTLKEAKRPRQKRAASTLQSLKRTELVLCPPTLFLEALKGKGKSKDRVHRIHQLKKKDHIPARQARIRLSLQERAM